MEQFIEDISGIKNAAKCEYDSFPDLELYMDQVLLCLNRQQPRLRDEEKTTSSMVNNYIKAGLMPKANGKKYSREHLAYLTIISKLKQVLSVKDTGRLIKTGMNGSDMRDYYTSFNDILADGYGELIDKLRRADGEELSRTALSLALSSYVNKVVCEYILDELEQGGDEKK